MSTLSKTNKDDCLIFHSCQYITHLNNNLYSSHVLKSKNIFKYECNKALKRKLKKYKLRKDGKEDQDVIDVSQSLHLLLKIKSPSKATSIRRPSKLDGKEFSPRNYLFEMARRKLKAESKNTHLNSKSPKKATINFESSNSDSQDKKETDAFKLLMESRNKSIGTNSPGKETIDKNETKEGDEKKKVKVKRNLALQKMAEAKGSLKKKEEEDLKEQIIKKKMEVRAERLKNMIVNTKPKKPKSSVMKTKKTLIRESDASSHTKDSPLHLIKPSHALKSINIFDETLGSSVKSSSYKNKKKSKEDEDFLHKLAPSIKKKENMLCYFNKIDKKSESSPSYNDDHDQVIKKLESKIKKKIKKRKLNLHRDPNIKNLKDHNEKNSFIDINYVGVLEVKTHIESGTETRKRKKKKITVNNQYAEVKEECVKVDMVENGRPKRLIKKPVKYIDDVQLSSSDEELYIFTPKKRKRVENLTNTFYEKSNEILKINEELCKLKPKKNKGKHVKVQSKPAKLAPIFATRPQLQPAEIEAKHKFLYSGVPDQLKRSMALKNNAPAEIINDFPAVVHVQQTVVTNVRKNVLKQTCAYSSDSDSEIATTNYRYHINVVKETKKTVSRHFIFNKNVHAMLQSIKDSYPQFPVYRTYHLLRGKHRGELKYYKYLPNLDKSIELFNSMKDPTNESTDNLNWTDRYRPITTNQLIGNFNTIKDLKKWLTSWTEHNWNPKSENNNSDSSDFYDSDTDSRDSNKSINNLLIISGPVGSGKTSSVYAIASELAMKVIEVNPSSKRTGKSMLQDLQEATQSHKVNRCNGSLDKSQKFQDVLESPGVENVKKRGRPKKNSFFKKAVSSEKKESSQFYTSQKSVRTCMSLILIDDADIVFEQDDGFSSAIAQLIQYSKRPVVLVASSLACPHLQRFLNCGKVLHMHPFLPRMLGTWLDIMCLADTGLCWPGLGAKFLDFYKGDIRKTINILQFYMTSQIKEPMLDSRIQNSDYQLNIDGENSNMSWLENDNAEEQFRSLICDQLENDAWQGFMSEQVNLLNLHCPLQITNIWWNIPKLFSEVFDMHTSDNEEGNKKLSLQGLTEIAQVLELLSVSDFLGQVRPAANSNVTSKPWFSAETDSVSELENFDNFNKYYDVLDEIQHDLVVNSITYSQKMLKCERNTVIQFPDMATLREKDRKVTRHENFTSFLSPSAVLDRKALALDYWSSCRMICRIEKNKVDVVSKRNNRFCHYLKSMNMLCRNDSFDKLGDSLSSEIKK